MVLAERARAARLEHILKLINRSTFGKRSEKLPVDQLALTLEDQNVALGEADGLQDKAAEEAGRYGLRPRRRRAPDAERASLPAQTAPERPKGVPLAMRMAAASSPSG